jgi:hypothetical protein
MPVSPDLARLAVLFDIAATSEHAGEAEAALHKALPILRGMRAAGLRAGDLVEAYEQRFELLDAAKKLVAERDAARGEAERFRKQAANGHGGTLAQAWVDTGTPRTVESRHAVWLLGLGVHHTQKEIDFLNKCAGRRGSLTSKQRDWLTDLVRNAVARTGQAPPP